MTARAHVSFDHGRWGVALWLGRKTADGLHIVEPVDLVVTTTTLDEVAAWTEPTLRLPEDMARALLDALAGHFGGTSDVQTLRKDYLAERARVDLMIGHLTSAPRAAEMGA